MGLVLDLSELAKLQVSAARSGRVLVRRRDGVRGGGLVIVYLCPSFPLTGRLSRTPSFMGRLIGPWFRLAQSPSRQLAGVGDIWQLDRGSRWSVFQTRTPEEQTDVVKRGIETAFKS